MGLFTKKCAYCGQRLEPGRQIQRMSKRFCSEPHADSYFEHRQASANCGGCC